MDRPSTLVVYDTPAPGQPDPALMHLGVGEREALVLAEELGTGAFLTDDLEGREEAMHRGIEVTGTLGILERAAQRALLDLPTAIAQLQATTFYGAPDIIAAMLAACSQEKADVAAMRRGSAHVAASGHRSCDRQILSCKLKVGSLEWSAEAHAMTQVLTGVLAPLLQCPKA